MRFRNLSERQLQTAEFYYEGFEGFGCRVEMSSGFRGKTDRQACQSMFFPDSFLFSTIKIIRNQSCQMSESIY